MEALSIEAGASELANPLVASSGAASVAHKGQWPPCHHVEPTSVLVQSARNWVSQKAETQKFGILVKMLVKNIPQI